MAGLPVFQIQATTVKPPLQKISLSYQCQVLRREFLHWLLVVWLLNPTFSLVSSWKRPAKRFLKARRHPETQIFYESSSGQVDFGEYAGCLWRQTGGSNSRIDEDLWRIVGTDIWITGSHWWWALKGECLLIVDDGAEEKADKSEEAYWLKLIFSLKPAVKKQGYQRSCEKYGLNKSDLYSTYHQ